MKTLPLPRHPRFQQWVRDQWLAGLEAVDILNNYDPPFKYDISLASSIIVVCAKMDSILESTKHVIKTTKYQS